MLHLARYFQANLLHWQQYCSEYISSSSLACSNCYASFKTGAKECITPKLPIPNCLSYAPDESCFLCTFGYKITSNTCQRIEEGSQCLLFDWQGECKMCSKGLVLIKGRCESNLHCSIINCPFCAMEKSKEICLRCSRGFALVGGKDNSTCLPAINNLKNCQVTLDGEICSSCHLNYFLYKGKCLQSSRYYFDIDWLDYEESQEISNSLEP